MTLTGRDFFANVTSRVEIKAAQLSGEIIILIGDMAAGRLPQLLTVSQQIIEVEAFEWEGHPADKNADGVVIRTPVRSIK